MKKLLSFLAFAAFMTACNNESKTDTPVTDTAVTTPTISPATDSIAATAAPAVKDSMMQYKDGKVMVMAGGSWSVLTATVTTTNGRKVSPDGEVSKGKVKRKLEEGMMIDKDGQMMDKDGKMMDNTGWE